MGTFYIRNPYAAMLLAGAWGPAVGQEASAPVSHHSSRTNWWRAKLQPNHVPVAVMKRHARKRRNVRARSSKRRRA